MSAPTDPIDPFTPVFDGYLADPFVMNVGGVYYAVGTAGQAQYGGRLGGRQFPLLRSTDLAHWELLGGALAAPEDLPGLGEFWAPEIAQGDDGRFYLYYSVGASGEMHHQLRVGVAGSPEGPYVDAGGPALVPKERAPFTIDAHPFRDEDGTWYLFYARDFLEIDGDQRAGTALVVDRLETMTRLAGEERTVLRARHDWQRFEKDRRMAAYDDRVFDWHTLEGAFVLRHGGRYWCLYSGAAYGTHNYGVDYGVANAAAGPYSDLGGEEKPRVLYTLPGRLLGPGHCSSFRDANGQDWLAFHAWDAAHTKRRMHLDRLVWTPDGPRAACLLNRPA
jgi:beta-xylosidase